MKKVNLAASLAISLVLALQLAAPAPVSKAAPSNVTQVSDTKGLWNALEPDCQIELSADIINNQWGTFDLSSKPAGTYNIDLKGHMLNVNGPVFKGLAGKTLNITSSTLPQTPTVVTEGTPSGVGSNSGVGFAYFKDVDYDASATVGITGGILKKIEGIGVIKSNSGNAIECTGNAVVNLANTAVNSGNGTGISAVGTNADTKAVLNLNDCFVVGNVRGIDAKFAEVSIYGGAVSMNINTDRSPSGHMNRGGGVYGDEGAFIQLFDTKSQNAALKAIGGKGALITGNQDIQGSGIGLGPVDKYSANKEAIKTLPQKVAPTLVMHKGVVANNTAVGLGGNNNGIGGEGGGIASEYASGARCVLLGGEILNNSTSDAAKDWGGGGIFGSEGTYTSISANAAVYDNLAMGLGGGVAACSTGTMVIPNYLCVFDNIAQAADGHFTRDGTQKPYDRTYWNNTLKPLSDQGQQGAKGDDVFGSHETYVMGTYTNDGGTTIFDANWSGAVDSGVINEESEDLGSRHVLTLKGGASTQDKQSIMNSAVVKIHNNKSNTHGGGILINGYLLPMDVGDIITPQVIKVGANKIFKDQNGDAISGTSFDFKLEEVDETGNVTRDMGNFQSDATSGAISIPLEFSEAGTYRYKISETNKTNSRIIYDSRAIFVKVTANKSLKVSQQMYKWQETAEYPEGTLVPFTLNIFDVSIPNNTVQISDNVSGPYTDVTLTDGVGTQLNCATGVNFNNLSVTTKSITVNKIWSDGIVNTDNLEVTAQLKRSVGDGAAVNVDGAVTLNKANNFSHTFQNQDIMNDNSEAYNYSVVETAVTYNGDDVTGEFNIAYSIDDDVVDVNSHSISQRLDITNTPKLDKKTINVVKEFDADVQNIGELTVGVQLYRTDDADVAPAPVGDVVELNQASNFSHSFANLPRYNGNSEAYTYSVKETYVKRNGVDVTSKFVPTYTAGEEEFDRTTFIVNQDFHIKNVAAADNKNIVVKKNWDPIIKRTEVLGVKVQLKRSVGAGAAESVGEAVELNSQNNFTHTFENMPRTDEYGALYSYSISETEVTYNGNNVMDEFKVPAYTVDDEAVDEDGKLSQTLSVLNTPNMDKKKITITKNWDDSVKLTNLLQVKCKLQRSIGKGEPADVAGYADITLNSANDFKFTTEDVDRYDANGKEYHYSIVETAVNYSHDGTVENVLEDFFVNYDEVAGDVVDPDTFLVTQSILFKNVPKMQIKSINISKEFDDSTQDVEDLSVYVQLYRRLVADEVESAGEWEAVSDVIELNSANEFKKSFANMLRYADGGRFYEYEVRELKVEREGADVTGMFSLDVADEGEQIDQMTFVVSEDIKLTNTTAPNIKNLTIKKDWDEHVTSLAAYSVNVQLYRKLADTIAARSSADAANDLEPVGDVVTLNMMNSFEHTYADLPRMDAYGRLYEYSVKEISVLDDGEDVTDEFVPTYRIESEKIVDGNVSQVASIKNSIKIKKTNIDIVKKWDGEIDNVQALGVTVQLYRAIFGGVPAPIGTQIVLNAENNFRAIVNDLDSYDANDRKYIYSVREVGVSMGSKDTTSLFVAEYLKPSEQIDYDSRVSALSLGVFNKLAPGTPSTVIVPGNSSGVILPNTGE